MKQSSRFLILALSMAAVAGCGNSDDKGIVQVPAGQPYGDGQQQYGQQQYPQQSGQPVIVNQPAAQPDNTMSNMLLGGLIGHAIGSSGNSSRERIVERRYETRPASIAPAASSSYQQPVQKPQAATPAPAAKTYAGWGSPSSKPAPVASQPAKSYSGWGSSTPAKSSSSSYSSKSYGRKR